MESKKGARTWIQFGCTAIIFIIGGYLLLANFFHMYAISGKSTVKMDTQSRENRQVLNQLETTLAEKNQQLEEMNHTNTFTAQELLSLKNYLKTVEEQVRNSQCWDEQQMTVNDVHVYEYLQCVKNMLPDSELMQSISKAVEGKTIDGIDLDKIYQEKVMEYDSYAEYELSQLQENYHYYTSKNRDKALMETVTFAQKYIVNVLEDHIHLANFLLEDGGAM